MRRDGFQCDGRSNDSTTEFEISQDSLATLLCPHMCSIRLDGLSLVVCIVLACEEGKGT